MQLLTCGTHIIKNSFLWGQSLEGCHLQRITDFLELTEMLQILQRRVSPQCVQVLPVNPNRNESLIQNSFTVIGEALRKSLHHTLGSLVLALNEDPIIF